MADLLLPQHVPRECWVPSPVALLAGVLFLRQMSHKARLLPCCDSAVLSSVKLMSTLLAKMERGEPAGVNLTEKDNPSFNPI
ncbi:hypothetical protein V6N13_119398 [Hibiscus sabdariffa]|uniref:Uncharacterized protein n=1 Tax=Hibiscus sabdariffa TaxID=183260 RepID=A0ABR2E135_9ROSI